MTSKRIRAGQASPPPGADDFRQIDGVGPVNAQRLYAAGITTFGQLAALSPDTIVSRLGGQPGLATRIAEEDWVGQARALAVAAAAPVTLGGAGEADPASVEPLLAEEPRTPRYASFAVTLLLNPDNSVLRTRISHAPPEGGEEKDSWLRWDSERLLHFIVQHGRLKVPAEAALPSAKEAPGADAAEPAPTLPAPRLRRFNLLSLSADAPQNFVSSRDPCQVCLELDLVELFAAGVRPQHYAVTVRAKRLGSSTRLVAGQAQGLIADETGLCIAAPARVIPAGVYRLEADVELSIAAGDKPYKAPFTLPGELINVY
ncbi:MAG TPA: hypothetical protein PKD53_18130 [Chloroflexaceae bacterium]|nr:hypothetical protein [Chloroflexaceae bacterium]